MHKQPFGAQSRRAQPRIGTPISGKCFGLAVALAAALLTSVSEVRAQAPRQAPGAVVGNVFSATGTVAHPKTDPLAIALGADLAAFHYRYVAVAPNGTAAATNFVSDASYLQVSGNRVLVEAVASGQTFVLSADLVKVGAEITGVAGRMVSCWVPVAALDDVAALNSLRFAQPAYKPQVGIGATTSQGDKALRTDTARSVSGFNGAGVKVGVLSDSYNAKSGAASDVTSGDLPGTGNPNGFTTPVDVVQDLSGNSDEGRAMLQIVHDVAPGAPLAFATAFVGGQPGFANNIRLLRSQSNCKIITDDVFYFVEPFFQDGVIAQAVDEVVNAGIPYFTLAGNNGRNAYQSAFRNSGIDLVGTGPGKIPSSVTTTFIAHDFDPGAGVDTLQTITFPGGSTPFTFQWADPFFSVSGGAGAQSDLDIAFFDTSGNYLGGSFGDNIGQDAVEFQSINGPVTLQIAIGKFSGPDPSLMKYIAITNGRTFTFNEPSTGTSSGSVYGHSNSARAATVGAADYRKTPQFGTTPPLKEGFSASGGGPILFNTSGGAVNISRQAPDFVAPDGGNTTFFGSDADGDGFPNFFGTSAAAPHAAAVGALLLQARSSLTPDQMYSAMQNTAIDMAAPGVDLDTGFGLLDGAKAVETVSAALDVTLDGGDNFLIRRNGSQVELLVDGTLKQSLPYSDLGLIKVQGNANNNSLTVDFAGGNPIPPNGISYDGAGQTSTPGDRLALQGGSFDTINYNFTNANNGSVTLDADGSGPIAPSNIVYTNLEPITDSVGAANRVFNYNGGAETIALQNSAAAGQSSLVSTLGESVAFNNPTASLAINGNVGPDTFSLNAPDAAFAAAVTVNAATGSATFNLQGVAGSGAYNLNGGSAADTFNVTPSANNVINIDGNAPTTAPGDVLNYNAEGRVATNNGSSISAPGVSVVNYQEIETVNLQNVGIPNLVPIVTLPDGPATYVENAAPVIIAPNATVTDADSPDFSGGSLTVSLAANGTTTDILGIRNQGSAAGQIGVASSDVTFGGVVIGSFTGGSGTTPLNITFNATATPAAAQALARNITFANGSDNPSTAPRSVGFAVNDGDGGISPTATATVNVTAVNDAPVANDQSVTLAEDTPQSITLTATDAENNTLTYRVIDAPQNGTLFGTPPNLTYTPNLNFNGSDSFTFRANDGALDSNLATVSLTISPINDPPVNTVPSAQTIVVNTPLIFSAGTGNAISIGDADAGSGLLEEKLTVSNGTLTLNGTSGLTFSVGDGTADVTMTFRGTLAAINAALDGLTYDPQVLAAGFSNTDTLTIVTDDLGNSGGASQTDTDTVAITVGNTAALSINNAAAVPEGNSGQGNAAVFTVTLSQTSTQEVRVSYLTQSGSATEDVDFVRTQGELVFAPGDTSKTILVPIIGDTLAEGEESFTVRLSNPRNANLNIQAFTGNATITDDDAAMLALTIAPNIFSEAAGANAAIGTVSRNTSTSAALTVSLRSSVISKATVPASVIIPAGQTEVTFAVSAVDDKVVDSDAIVAITASSDGLVAATTNVTVTNDDVPPPPNQAPTANPQNLSTNEDTALALTLSGSDPEGSALNFRIIGAPLYRPTGSVNFSPAFEGTLFQNNQNVVFTPPQDFNGDVKFSFVANDNQVDSQPATITVQVLAVNDAPVASSDKIRFVLQNSQPISLPITLKASDVDNDALTYFVGTDLPGDSSETGRSIGPVYGTLSGTAPNLIYTPPAGYRGRDVFTFYVSDGKTFSQRARIDILVSGSRGVVAANDSYTLDLNDTNDAGQTPPQAKGITFRDGTFRIDAPGVIANDRDPANGNLIVRLARTTSNGRLALRSDGSFDYTPNAGFVGTDFFAYMVGTTISQAQGRVRLIVRDRRGPELFFDAPADDIVTSQVTEIRGRVRDGNSGLKSISLLWRREADGKFWNGSRWVAGETPLPLAVQGINWRYLGALPQPGNDPNVSLVDGDYALQVTAVDKSNNTNRVVNSIIVDHNAPDAPANSPVRLSLGSAASTQNAIVLNFTGALDATSASDATKYRVMIDGVAVKVPQATYANNSVTLSALSFNAGQIIDVQINGLRDATGRRLPTINARVLSR